jgi:hypothetical protein
VAVPAKTSFQQMYGGRDRSASTHGASIPANVKISNFDNEKYPLDRGPRLGRAKVCRPYRGLAGLCPAPDTRSRPRVYLGRDGADGMLGSKWPLKTPASRCTSGRVGMSESQRKYIFPMVR